MAQHVALTHTTHYRFDRKVRLSPHELRLRPAPQTRTPVLGYALDIQPAEHFLNWVQDPQGNWIARVVFPEPTDELRIEVGLRVEMVALNPFDFFLEPSAAKLPFAYPAALAADLAPLRTATTTADGEFGVWLQEVEKLRLTNAQTVDFLVAVNQALARRIAYQIRLEPGVQSVDETLTLASGSCRDSAWVLVETLRALGLAARFVSGYLIQLRPDPELDGSIQGPTQDFSDLHAWAEVYVPGAGWLGLDATSGLFAGEGHIPLATSITPEQAAPVIGYSEPCEAQLEFALKLRRLSFEPRPTAPLDEAAVAKMHELGAAVDARLNALDVRLTQGGEPTFVAGDDPDAPEWNTEALSPAKYRRACALLKTVADAWLPGALLHFGQGKWYPGEPLPRFALTAIGRRDGTALIDDPTRLADPALPGRHALADARRLAAALGEALGFAAAPWIEAFEDPLAVALHESRAPLNLDPTAAKFHHPYDRTRWLTQLAGGLLQPVALVLPLTAEPADDDAPRQWRSGPWRLRRDRLYLLPGASPAGYRLPLESLPIVEPSSEPKLVEPDPFAPRQPLAQRPVSHRARFVEAQTQSTALLIELRDGRLHVFLPPLTQVQSFVALVEALEQAAAQAGVAVVVEGYLPAPDPRLRRFAITPDPGVLEVNVDAQGDWPALVAQTESLYAHASKLGLKAEKFLLDGRHTGTGGGFHITLGGATAADSPWLRRPDLLRSLLVYMQNHPALSYAFSSLFVGPTSQSPRVDEARDDTLYELAIALDELAQNCPPGESNPWPWQVDRILRNFLVDLTGNTHRCELSIDKLYPPDGAALRLGLIELRAFEMPPHPQMALTQMLLLRSLIAWFWERPYCGGLVDFGHQRSDRYFLPSFLEADLRAVVKDLNQAGYAFDARWFRAQFEFRFPCYGTLETDGLKLSLRQAIEPWHVLGEEASAGGTARYVDSSLERIEARIEGHVAGRHLLLCNGRVVPLTGTGEAGVAVAGVRFRAWAPPSALHPTIGIHSPLHFELVELPSATGIGGVHYHVSHPGGRSHETRPVNALEAQARRRARFDTHAGRYGPVIWQSEALNPRHPLTLDLRRQPKPPIAAF